MDERAPNGEKRVKTRALRLSREEKGLKRSGGIRLELA
jgi:hypothetical protein